MTELVLAMHVVALAAEPAFELRPQPPAESPYVLDVSEDGHLALAGSKSIQLWDLRTGRVLRTFSVGDAIDFAAGFGPKGTVIVAANDVRVYDAATGALTRTHALPSEDTENLVVLPDGGVTWVATRREAIDEHRIAERFTVNRRGRVVGEARSSFSAYATVASPDGAFLAEMVGGEDLDLSSFLGLAEPQETVPDGIVVVRTDDGAELARFPGYLPAFSPDGSLWFTRDDGIWRWRPGAEPVPTGIEGWVMCAMAGRVAISTVDGPQVWTDDLQRVAAFGPPVVSADGAFLPDGRLLVPLEDGLELLDVAEQRPVWVRHLAPTGADALAFTADGKALVTAGPDRLYRWDLGVMAVDEMGTFALGATDAGQQVFDLRWDGVAALTIVGGSRREAALARSNQEVQLLFRELAAAAGVDLGATDTKTRQLRLWEVATGRSWRPFDAGTVFDAAFAANGWVLALDEEPLLHVYDGTAGQPVGDIGFAPDFPGPKARAMLSCSTPAKACAAWIDGKVQVWVLQGDVGAPTFAFDTQPELALFAVSAFALSPDGGRIAIAGRGRRDREAYELGFLEVWDVKTGAKLAALEGQLTSIDAVAFSPDGARVASGAGNGEVRLWDASSGAEIARLGAHDGPVADVTFSPDGRLVASASPVDAVYLWNAPGLEARGHDPSPWARASSPGHVGLAANADGEWVAFDDLGRFDASRRGGDLVNVVRGTEAFAVDQFALSTNRPDLVLERIGLGDPDVLAHFRARAERRMRAAGLDPAVSDLGDVPEVRILSTSRDGRELTIRAEARGAKLRTATVSVNDVPASPAIPLRGRKATFEVTVPLSVGDDLVEVSAVDARGAESIRASALQRVDDDAPRALWFVGLGVSDYADDALDLAWAHQDALDLGERLGRAGAPFDTVHTLVRTDAQVSPSTFDEARDFLAEAGVDDTIVVFVAGHGMHSRDAEARYYFLPHGGDPDRLAETSVPDDRLEELLSGVRARRKLLLLDTCESGEVEDGPVVAAAAGTGRGVRVATAKPATVEPPRPWLWNRERYLYNDLVRRTGAVVFSSSRGGELSYESADVKNGYFTEELLAAIAGAGDADGDGAIDMDELRATVSRAVADRSGGAQHPTVDRDNPKADLALPVLPEP